MSVSDTIAMDKNAPPVTDSVRAMQNTGAQDWSYFLLNGVASTTVATTPGCATATVTSQVKTTNATVLRASGALVALAATDNFWTLTGGVLAISSFRRYLLCSTAGVASVVASLDSTTNAAACRWTALPANGTSIVGVVTIATNGSTTFTPGTTLLGAAGITTTYIDGIDVSVPRVAIVAA